MSAEQPKPGFEIKPDHVIAFGRGIVTLILPWLAARFVFKPRISTLPKDRLLDRLAFWRSAAGLLVVVTASMAWREPFDVVGETFSKAFMTAWYAALALPLSFLVMLGTTRSGYRAELLRGGLRLLGRVALGAGAITLPIAPFVLLDGEEVSINTGGKLLVFILVVLFIVCWYAPFWVCTIYWAARTSFWTSEIHPLLAPVASSFLVLLITGREMVKPDTESLPVPLWFTLNICGVLSTLTLAVVEYRHARANGFRFRYGPRPVAAPQPHPQVATR
ncbi:hypothetical protein AB0H34_37270 [Saccharopolyspora shandongensis]|uniref:hypothetical protein n=1 Tax=Saccharopolyspora shandongensis TaxID=418495 RepID=UPI0033E827EF